MMVPEHMGICIPSGNTLLGVRLGARNPNGFKTDMNTFLKDHVMSQEVLPVHPERLCFILPPTFSTEDWLPKPGATDPVL